LGTCGIGAGAVLVATEDMMGVVILKVELVAWRGEGDDAR